MMKNIIITCGILLTVNEMAHATCLTTEQKKDYNEFLQNAERLKYQIKGMSGENEFLTTLSTFANYKDQAATISAEHNNCNPLKEALKRQQEHVINAAGRAGFQLKASQRPTSQATTAPQTAEAKPKAPESQAMTPQAMPAKENPKAATALTPEAVNALKILGLTETATKEQIKKAYNKLALTYHPDKNKSKDAEEKFKEVLNANELLKKYFP